MNSSTRFLSTLLLAAAALLAGCSALPDAHAAAPAARPRLVLFLVIDGLPQRQLEAYRDQLAPDGLARFLERGAWYSQAHYGHSFTVTAAGHAALLTGAYPHRSGIIANEWRDIRTGEAVANTGDPAAHYIGHAGHPLDGTSPRNLRAESLGDVLRRVDPRSKVIAISGKDRGAILPAGKAGTAYMYMSETGRFASTTYYMAQHPAWVEAFNAGRPADRWFKAEWKALLPEAAYARSLPDGQPWFARRGARLPMPLSGPNDDAPGPAYYTALLQSPYGDALSLDFARAAIAGEQLGRDDAPDLLVLSLSSHDYVNHLYSAESRLSQDHLLQVDRLLEQFFRDLDATVGRDQYLAVLSTDHGFMPAPEASLAQGRPAGRLSGTQLLARVNAELERVFGLPRLVPFTSASALMLDRKAIAAKGLDFDAVAEAARSALAAEPAIAAAYTRRELASGSRTGAPFFDAIRKSWHPDLSGDVPYVLAPYWMMASNSATTHGSPHPYDSHVPILLWGPRWVKPGRIDAPVEVVDIAPAHPCASRCRGGPAGTPPTRADAPD
jgi:predicted AlkP superfamily pyrophosphatase or phosphodiesterase